MVYLTAQAVPESQRELVIPHIKARLLQRIRQRPRDRFLILARMANKNIPHRFWHRAPLRIAIQLDYLGSHVGTTHAVLNCPRKLRLLRTRAASWRRLSPQTAATP